MKSKKKFKKPKKPKKPKASTKVKAPETEPPGFYWDDGSYKEDGCPWLFNG